MLSFTASQVAEHSVPLSIHRVFTELHQRAIDLVTPHRYVETSDPSGQVPSCLPTRRHKHKHKRKHKQTHTRTHTDTPTYIYIYIHTHAQPGISK